MHREHRQICFFSQIQPITQTTVIECEQVTQLLQRDHTAGWVSYNQKWKTGTGRQYLSRLQVHIQPL